MGCQEAGYVEEKDRDEVQARKGNVDFSFGSCAKSGVTHLARKSNRDEPVLRRMLAFSTRGKWDTNTNCG